MKKENKLICDCNAACQDHVNECYEGGRPNYGNGIKALQKRYEADKDNDGYTGEAGDYSYLT